MLVVFLGGGKNVCFCSSAQSKKLTIQHIRRKRGKQLCYRKLLIHQVLSPSLLFGVCGCHVAFHSLNA